MTTPITVAAARKVLTAEGHTPDDVETAINSLYNAGFAIPAAQQLAVAYESLHGTAALVTWGPLAWIADGELAYGTNTLTDAVREMSMGEWLPNEGDGWSRLDGEFDPKTTHAEWTATKVAEAEAASIDEMLLTEDDLTVLREQLAEWAANAGA